MKNKNHIILIGNLGKEPEYKDTTNSQLAEFTVATNYLVGSGIDRLSQTDWTRVTCWGQLAQKVRDTISKGSRVSIEGEITRSEYEDADGDKRISYKINATSVSKVGKRLFGEDVNLVTLIGNIGEFNPEENITERDGIKFVKFGLASNKYTKNEDGSFNTFTTWHNIEMRFDMRDQNQKNLGERLLESIEKGNAIGVTGELKTVSYKKDNSDKTWYYTKVVTSPEKVFGIFEKGSSKDSNEEGNSESASNEEPKRSVRDEEDIVETKPVEKKKPVKKETEAEEEIEVEEIPF